MKSTCSAHDCSSQTYCRGMCTRHYQIWRRDEGPRCVVEGCTGGRVARSMCAKHYQRVKNTGAVEKRPRADISACSVKGCEALAHARGWCTSHYSQWRTSGVVGQLAKVVRGSLADRLDAYTDKSGDCWTWKGSLTTDGYGLISASGENRGRLAHRVMYEHMVGPVRADQHVDHMCRNTRCVNPSHLQAVSNKLNSENLATASRVAKSGIRGVYSSFGKWAASAVHDGKTYRAGRFDTIEEAAVAVRNLRLRLHTNNLEDRRILNNFQEET